MQTGEPRQQTHGFGDQKGPAQRGDEVFDVVDGNDLVIGQATRREVHAKGLWHRAVHVWVFAPADERAVESTVGAAVERNADDIGAGGVEGQRSKERDCGEAGAIRVLSDAATSEKSSAAGNALSGRRVFLQKRSLAKDSAPGCWDSSCSGHLDAGEDYPAAAVRELGEEIGLRVSGPDVLTEVLRVSACADTGWEFARVYRMESAGPFLLHPAEIERGDWWRVEDVTRAIAETPEAFSRAFRFIWARVVSESRE
jgi:isopentenyldiphosphate isomerase